MNCQGPLSRTLTHNQGLILDPDASREFNDYPGYVLLENMNIMVIVITAMMITILPTILNMIPRSRRSAAIATGMNSVALEDLLASRKSSPARKTAIINRTAGISFTLTV